LPSTRPTPAHVAPAAPSRP